MSRTTLSHRRLGALAVLLGLVVTVLVPAGAAQAAAYRYWGYYQLSGSSWDFAPKGPDQLTPADGAVEGWRYAIGGEDVTRMPRAVPTFDDICGDTDAESGKKRVAVVIDYGRTADFTDSTEPPAPVGRCAVVDTAASGMEVLTAVAEVRQDGGMVCGIDEIPATGCADEVKTVSAAAQEPDTAVELEIVSAGADAAAPADSDATDDDESSTGTYVGIGVAVLAVAAVGLVALRRRRQA